jgi:hypothetical protein
MNRLYLRHVAVAVAFVLGYSISGCSGQPNLGERLRGTWNGKETGVPYTLGEGKMIHAPSGAVYAEYTIIDERTIRLQHPAGPDSPAFDTMLTVEFDGDRMEWVREADGEPIFAFTRAPSR